MRKKIQDTLLSLGITPNLRGFEFICDAIEIIEEENRVKITYIYDKIAKKYDSTNGSQVERAIRHAISHVDAAVWVSIGGAGYKNSEFLYTLDLLIRRNNK